jgi:hypothetical protein
MAEISKIMLWQKKRVRNVRKKGPQAQRSKFVLPGFSSWLLIVQTTTIGFHGMAIQSVEQDGDKTKDMDKIRFGFDPVGAE